VLLLKLKLKKWLVLKQAKSFLLKSNSNKSNSYNAPATAGAFLGVFPIAAIIVPSVAATRAGMGGEYLVNIKGDPSASIGG
jgi:hypothetical protein